MTNLVSRVFPVVFPDGSIRDVECYTWLLSNPPKPVLVVPGHDVSFHPELRNYVATPKH